MNLWALWGKHGTKLLGIATTILSGSLTIDGLIPHGGMKWVAFSNLILGALTLNRGFSNRTNGPQT